MSAIKVYFEIGHEASPRSKNTPEGFTHDWEVFVRGGGGADISHFVDKVVFHLHETFPKPRRVVKEPPFSIKESGYAGFIFPIEIYLRNKDEPKKIKFSYDFTLQQSGLLKDRYIFPNPNEEFRKKLLKGGGTPISNNAFYTNPDQENRSRDSFTDEKSQLVSKPKLSAEIVKKHKIKSEHKDEMPHRTSSFENLFGPPIQKPPKVSPDPKKSDKSITINKEKKDKDKGTSEKKTKYDHKEVKLEKNKDKDKLRQEKVKNYSKEQEKTKEKALKRPSDRVDSPELIKKRCISPLKRPLSPTHISNISNIKEEYKPIKHSNENFNKKLKLDEKPIEIKMDKEVKEKRKKEKKSHDRDKERKDKKEHKKEGHKIKESVKDIIKELKEIPKQKDIPKDKENIKESPPIKDRSVKSEKVVNKFSIENLRKTPPPDEEHLEVSKVKEKSESNERKHKHKKKDKKRDESRDKTKESSKGKKHKHDKTKDFIVEKQDPVEHRETPLSKERQIPEPISPISLDTASQCSSKSGLAKLNIGTEEINSGHSDSENSIVAEEENNKMKNSNQSPEHIKTDPSPGQELESEPVIEPVLPQKEKSKKHKDKTSRREEKRRKRKAVDEDSENKLVKIDESGPSNNDLENGESSGCTSAETKLQDNGVSSSLGEDAEPGDLSPDYMVQLRGLQQRIMMIKNNEDLERVVNLIAETGRYEVTTQTFDFDLCLLDRSTVQQLIQLVGC